MDTRAKARMRMRKKVKKKRTSWKVSAHPSRPDSRSSRHQQSLEPSTHFQGAVARGTRERGRQRVETKGRVGGVPDEGEHVCVVCVQKTKKSRAKKQKSREV